MTEQFVVSGVSFWPTRFPLSKVVVLLAMNPGIIQISGVPKLAHKKLMWRPFIGRTRPFFCNFCPHASAAREMHVGVRHMNKGDHDGPDTFDQTRPAKGHRARRAPEVAQAKKATVNLPKSSPKAGSCSTLLSAAAVKTDGGERCALLLGRLMDEVRGMTMMSLSAEVSDDRAHAALGMLSQFDSGAGDLEYSLREVEAHLARDRRCW